jgi:hypothetical protein
MTLLRDLKERRELALARVQPHLWFTRFSVPDTLERVRREHFPEIPPGVQLYSVSRGPLACVDGGGSSPTIYVHQVLNHSDTPVEVFSLICKHELLHLRILPAVKGKRTIQHPPAFWDAERAIAPERNPVWCWVLENLGLCLKMRPRLERTDVLRNWRRIWSHPMLDMAACRQLLRGAAEDAGDVIW